MARILVVDDHVVVRDGLKRLLDELPSKPTFGEASSAPEALQLIKLQPWDVVVLDISLEDRSGLETLKEIKKIRPKLPVLILTMHSEGQYARRAFKAGASGYITKGSSRSVILEAIRRVMSGRKYVSPTLAEELVTDIERGVDEATHSILSDRELEVMRLIGSGKTVGEIAGQLSLSDRTVSTYRARILEKMKMRTNAEITRYAIENKLVD